MEFEKSDYVIDCEWFACKFSINNSCFKLFASCDYAFDY